MNAATSQRVQVAPGANCVAVLPVVTPFSTAPEHRFVVKCVGIHIVEAAAHILGRRLAGIAQRKVTNWARVTVAFGEKCVASVPLVMPFSTAQRIAS